MVKTGEKMQENQNIEWKESWRDEYLKWICGFANAHGGKIYIGKNDKGVIVGLSNSKSLMEDIPNKILDTLGIVCDINLITHKGKDCIEILVEPGIYPVNYKGEYHYRSGSTKKRLTGTALTQFLLKKTGRTWDNIPVDNLKIRDLRNDAFDEFREKASEAKRINSKDLRASNENILAKLNLLDGKNLTKAAILLFSHQPERLIPGCYVKIAYFSSSAKIEYQDEIHGSILMQCDKVIDLLYTKYLKSKISYNGITRVETYPYPMEAIREIVINAIAHRDYSTLTPIQIKVYDDHIVVANDCVFPEDWTVETLMSEHNSRPYNPNIAAVFYKAGLIESWGRGISQIRESCEIAGNEMPDYNVKPSCFSVTFYAKNGTQFGTQNSENGTQSVENIPNKGKQQGNKNGTQFGTQSTENGTQALENISDTAKYQVNINGTQGEKNDTQNKRLEEYSRKITEFIKNDNTITTEKLAHSLGVSVRTIKRYIKLMGNVKYVGSGFSGHWVIIGKCY